MLFEVEQVRFRYEQVNALDGLSLSVSEGQRVALLGANGSGKSTLLRLLDGLYFPEAGSIRFRGEPLTEDRFADEQFAISFRRRVGLVFQNPDVQLFNPTVLDEVAFGPLQMRWPAAQVRERVEQALEEMGIAHLRDRPPHRLSGGEKKRVALASVLVLDPEVLLLDEPTAALDPKSQSHIIDMLVGWRGGAKTIVAATHDLDSIEDIADHCCVFENGRIAAEGVPESILADLPLLERTGLLHSHRHAHDAGTIHAHPHRHHRHRA
jgi:cobalt/nickel transport system ATP-binding protein